MSDFVQTDFSGGITDYPLDAEPNRVFELNNFVIENDGSLRQRPAFVSQLQLRIDRSLNPSHIFIFHGEIFAVIGKSLYLVENFIDGNLDLVKEITYEYNRDGDDNSQPEILISKAFEEVAGSLEIDTFQYRSHLLISYRDIDSPDIDHFPLVLFKSIDGTFNLRRPSLPVTELLDSFDFNDTLSPKKILILPYLKYRYLDESGQTNEIRLFGQASQVFELLLPVDPQRLIRDNNGRFFSPSNEDASFLIAGTFFPDLRFLGSFDDPRLPNVADWYHPYVDYEFYFYEVTPTAGLELFARTKPVQTFIRQGVFFSGGLWKDIDFITSAEIRQDIEDRTNIYPSYLRTTEEVYNSTSDNMPIFPGYYKFLESENRVFAIEGYIAQQAVANSLDYFPLTYRITFDDNSIDAVKVESNIVIATRESLLIIDGFFSENSFARSRKIGSKKTFTGSRGSMISIDGLVYLPTSEGICVSDRYRTEVLDEKLDKRFTKMDFRKSRFIKDISSILWLTSDKTMVVLKRSTKSVTLWESQIKFTDIFVDEDKPYFLSEDSRVFGFDFDRSIDSYPGFNSSVSWKIKTTEFSLGSRSLKKVLTSIIGDIECGPHSISINKLPIVKFNAASLKGNFHIRHQKRVNYLQIEMTGTGNCSIKGLGAMYEVLQNTIGGPYAR